MATPTPPNAPLQWVIPPEKRDGPLQVIGRFLGKTFVPLVASVLVAAVAAYFAVLGSRTTARSTAIDQATGAARAYLIIFQEMQSSLDGMLRFNQKIYPAVYGRAWTINADDLKALGVALKPAQLLVVEEASQKFTNVFPPDFNGLKPTSKQAHVAFTEDRSDMEQAEELARCAEIYLARIPNVSLPTTFIGSAQPAQRWLTRCSNDFPVHTATRRLFEGKQVLFTADSLAIVLPCGCGAQCTKLDCT